MKARVLFVLLTGMVLLITGCARQGGGIVLRAADDHAEGYPTVEALKFMADLVQQRTNGQIKIQVYPSAQLGSEKETIEMLRMGALDINRVSCSPLTEVAPEIGVFSLPYLFRDEAHAWRVLDGEIGQALLKKLEDYGMVGLCYYDAGARSFYTKKPVRTLQDLKGMKIRTQKNRIMMDLVEALGGAAVPMAFEEVYSALQTGVIDGAENNLPSYYETGHYEVAKYYTLDEHTRVPEVVLVSMKTWQKLTPQQREILRQAAKESEEYQKKLWKEYRQKAYEKVTAAGCQIIKPEDLESFRNAVSTIYKKYEEQLGEWVKKIQAVK